MKNVEGTTKALEYAVDSKVLAALSTSLEEVLVEAESEYIALTNDLALETLKNVLATFPKHAQDHVIGLFNGRSRQSFDTGHDKGFRSHYSHHSFPNPDTDKTEPEDFTDLLVRRPKTPAGPPPEDTQMKFTLRDNLLQLTDPSNWPPIDIEAEYYGYECAMQALHEVIMEYWDHPDMEKEAK
jgi:hypothetical protein